jgi:hypothetical protein
MNNLVIVFGDHTPDVDGTIRNAILSGYDSKYNHHDFNTPPYKSVAIDRVFLEYAVLSSIDYDYDVIPTKALFIEHPNSFSSEERDHYKFFDSQWCYTPSEAYEFLNEINQGN